MSRRSLGANRPRSGYGAEGKSISKRLARHAELMREFVAVGFSRDEASKKAYAIVRGVQP